MGYFAYNIYLIEFEKMLSSSTNIRKEIDIIQGVYDYKTYTEIKFITDNTSKKEFVDINPSVNQEGGAEYSYNFWLYINKDKISEKKSKDIVLFFKGEKLFYKSKANFNCSALYKVLIKNPLVRLKSDGSSLVVDFNNIYNSESYQNKSNNKICTDNINENDWKSKNKNMVGIYNLDFNNKWFMVTIVMKEVSDSNNILMKNRASCKIYINGINVLDKKVETVYNGSIYSATFKNNKSPFYIKPRFDNIKENLHNFFNCDEIADENILKMADLKYFNYSIDDKKISELQANGFRKSEAVKNFKSEELRYTLVSNSEMEKNEIKEI